MVIYGVSLLSFCYFIGVLVGDILGVTLKVKANVGGVGFAMLLLVILVDKLMTENKLSKLAQDGIKFWSLMYIPIVVAMAAQQNVVSAIKGGPAAIIAGTLAVVLSFIFVPIISKIGGAPDIGKKSDI